MKKVVDVFDVADLPIINARANTIVFKDNAYDETLSNCDENVVNGYDISMLKYDGKIYSMQVDVHHSFKLPLHFIFIGRSESDDKNIFNLNVCVNDDCNADFFVSIVDLEKSSMRICIDFSIGGNCSISEKILCANDKDSTYKIDLHNRHKKSNSDLDVVARGIVSGKSSTEFNMQIDAEKNLEKIVSRETIKVLKLSDDAVFKSTPSIVCETENAKINHGFALSGFDKNEIYFLQSRGISKIESENILKDAFVASLQK